MSKLYFMYANESSKTGKDILEALKGEGVDVRGGHEPGENTKYDVLVRWGSTRPIATKPAKVINPLKSIQAASNKLEALKVLRANGVRVPDILASAEVTKFPVLGRKTHHVGGKDIILCLQRNDLQRAINGGAQYFTQYIPVKAEYRVHVFNGEPIKISQKILTNPDLATEPWIRNLDAGYTFHNQHSKLSARDWGLAVDAVDILGLNFGAADLIVGDDGQGYILEVNTAPGLIETGIAEYVKKFKEVLAS